MCGMNRGLMLMSGLKGGAVASGHSPSRRGGPDEPEAAREAEQRRVRLERRWVCVLDEAVVVGLDAGVGVNGAPAL